MPMVAVRSIKMLWSNKGSELMVGFEQIKYELSNKGQVLKELGESL